LGNFCAKSESISAYHSANWPKYWQLESIGISDTAVEKWEKNQNRSTESHRRRIIEFLGFDPAAPSLTGGF